LQRQGVRLELRDDGAGFDLKIEMTVGSHRDAERVEQMSGELEITSERGKAQTLSSLCPQSGVDVMRSKSRPV